MANAPRPHGVLLDPLKLVCHRVLHALQVLLNVTGVLFFSLQVLPYIILPSSQLPSQQQRQRIKRFSLFRGAYISMALSNLVLLVDSRGEYRVEGACFALLPDAPELLSRELLVSTAGLNHFRHQQSILSI